MSKKHRKVIILNWKLRMDFPSTSKFNPYEENSNDEENDQDNQGDEETAEQKCSDESSNDDEESTSGFPSDENRVSMVEQIYQEKLADLKNQLQLLKEKKHPLYLESLEKLEEKYKKRLELNVLERQRQEEEVEKEYQEEVDAAAKELEEKVAAVKKELMADIKAKRKLIVADRFSKLDQIESDTESKPLATRQLRRRTNEASPAIDRRKKASNIQLKYLLDDSEIEEDLRQMQVTSNNEESLIEVSAEEGRLLYERRLFYAGQPIYVEGTDIPRYPATIYAIRDELIWVKNISDDSKERILLSQLAYGTITIKRRAS